MRPEAIWIVLVLLYFLVGGWHENVAPQCEWICVPWAQSASASAHIPANQSASHSHQLPNHIHQLIRSSISRLTVPGAALLAVDPRLPPGGAGKTTWCTGTSHLIQNLPNSKDFHFVLLFFQIKREVPVPLSWELGNFVCYWWIQDFGQRGQNSPA